MSFGELLRYVRNNREKTTDFSCKNFHAHRSKFPCPSGKIFIGMKIYLHRHEKKIASGRKFIRIGMKIYLHTQRHIFMTDNK
jgi:hypothetical protein